MIVSRKFGEPHDFRGQQCLADRDRLVDGQPTQSLPAFLLRLSLVVLRISNHDPILPEAAKGLGEGSEFYRPRSRGGGEGLPIAVTHEAVLLAQILRLDPLGGQNALGQPHFVGHSAEVAERDPTASVPDANGAS